LIRTCRAASSRQGVHDLHQLDAAFPVLAELLLESVKGVLGDLHAGAVVGGCGVLADRLRCRLCRRHEVVRAGDRCRSAQQQLPRDGGAGLHTSGQDLLQRLRRQARDHQGLDPVRKRNGAGRLLGERVQERRAGFLRCRVSIRTRTPA